jgi:hypothetical protein
VQNYDDKNQTKNQFKCSQTFHRKSCKRGDEATTKMPREIRKGRAFDPVTQKHDWESTCKNLHKIKTAEPNQLKKLDLHWGMKPQRASREHPKIWGAWPSKLARRNERLRPVAFTPVRKMEIANGKRFGG